MTRSGPSLEDRLKARALDEGFDIARITTPDLNPDIAHYLDRFLADGFHGDMGWLKERSSWRKSPKVLWPDTASILMVAMNYGPDHDPLTALAKKDRGAISVYAHGKDYHDILKKRLKAVARWFCEISGGQVKVFVDTAPVLEKPLAQRAGLGWQGKHTNLVSRHFGSWLFLGAMFTSVPLRADGEETDHCGQCRRCLAICPTDAFPAPYQLNATRCISYLTIEHKGHIAEEFRVPMGNRIYGCDDCLAVCPWNKFAQIAREEKFASREDIRNAELSELLSLDDSVFRQRFRGSPIKRIGRDRFVRNVLIAAGNSENRDLLDIVRNLTSDPSPLVRTMAVWALWRLLDREEFGQAKAALSGGETDGHVLQEWSR